MTDEQQTTALALPDQVRASLEVQREQLTRLLGNSIDPERFIAVAYEVAKSPNLQRAHPATVLKAVWDAANLGLEPSGILGEGYLVTRWNRDLQAHEAQFQPGYRGLAQLARRSGLIVAIDWGVVYDEDKFAWSEGTTPWIEHEPARNRDERSKPTHAYAWAKDIHGQVYIAVLDRAEIEHIRSKSPAKDSGPWVSDWGEMAKKSAVRRLCKKLPLSPEIQRAVAMDDAAELGEVEATDGVALHGTDRLRAALEVRPKVEQAPPTEQAPTTPEGGVGAEPVALGSDAPVASEPQGERAEPPPPSATTPAVVSEAVATAPEVPDASGATPPVRCAHPASAHLATAKGVVCQLCDTLLAERTDEPAAPAPERPRRTRKPKPTEPTRAPTAEGIFDLAAEAEAAAPTKPVPPAAPKLQTWTGTTPTPFKLAIDEGTGKAKFALQLDANPDGTPSGKAQVMLAYDLVPDGLDAGQHVSVGGDLEMVPWPDDPSKPPYRRIHATQLEIA